MFARIFALVPFVLLASASHLEARTACNSGNIKCCNTDAYKSAVNKFGAEKVLLDIALGLSADIGFTCSPVSLVGVGANSCTQQAVCCDNNTFNGAVVVGCTPINVNA